MGSRGTQCSMYTAITGHEAVSGARARLAGGGGHARQCVLDTERLQPPLKHGLQAVKSARQSHTAVPASTFFSPQIAWAFESCAPLIQGMLK